MKEQFTPGKLITTKRAYDTVHHLWDMFEAVEEVDGESTFLGWLDEIELEDKELGEELRRWHKTETSEP